MKMYRAPQRNRNVVELRKRRDNNAAARLITNARNALYEQANAVLAMADRMGPEFVAAVETIVSTPGHVVIMGIGKSGHVGKKLAATLASTGTPSFFVHSSEAVHGDLGMITERDAAILISYSGETEEVVRLLPHLRHRNVPIIALVGDTDSTLAREADVVLDTAVPREVCPNNLAPTSSTLATMAMGDALSVALAERKRFRPSDFARLHPGGSLGRRLLSTVRDAMHTETPTVSPTDTVGESLVTMTQGRLGLVLVMNGHRLVGIVTDGDLRRGMQRHDDLLVRPVSDIMTDNPVTIEEDASLERALDRMRQMKLKALVVTGKGGVVSGVVEVFDDN